MRRVRALISPGLPHRIENAAIVFEPSHAGAAAGVVAVAEEPFEYRARLIFHGQRRGRIAPGKCVGVSAAITGVASADQFARIEAQFERGKLRLFAQFAAAIWSIEIPARISGPSVFLGCTPVKNVAAARA